jgi:redox-sensitive bicupin YhaK (pirin superfamily)
MMEIRRAHERGNANHGWLRSRHTFSFANYYDPRHMGFRNLRVINEDRVDGNRGFPPHGHRDMEIVSYVLGGALEHQDNMGTGSIIRPGEVQRMTAGTGVLHSEYNASADEEVHFLQIWLLPDARGRSPEYEQREFPEAERRGALRLLAAPGGEDGALDLKADAALYGAILGQGQEVRHRLRAGRGAWVQVVRGAVTVNGEALEAGDGAALEALDEVVLRGRGDDPAEVILFDLA